MLPFAAIGGPTTVLCIGADGHVAIEAGADGSCKGSPCGDHEGDEEGDCGHEDQDCDHEGNCCGDCADFTLVLEDGTQRQATQELAVSVQFVGNLILRLTSATHETPPVFRPDRSSPPIPSPPLESLRTIRLLI